MTQQLFSQQLLWVFGRWLKKMEQFIKGMLNREQWSDSCKVFPPIKALQQVVSLIGRPSPKQDSEITEWNQLQHCLVGRQAYLLWALCSKWLNTPKINPRSLPKLQRQLRNWRLAGTFRFQFIFTLLCGWALTIWQSKKNMDVLMGSCDWNHLAATCKDLSEFK